MQLDKLKFKQTHYSNDHWYPTNYESKRYTKQLNKKFFTNEEMEDLLDEKSLDIYCEERYENKLIADGYYFSIFQDTESKLYIGRFKNMEAGELYDEIFKNYKLNSLMTTMLSSIQEFFTEIQK